jgi:sugar lactone lactonase YvrE
MIRIASPLACLLSLVSALSLHAAEPVVWSTAYAIPKELTNQGSGYFSIVEGRNGKLYIGTAKYGVDSYLVEFDTTTKQMKVVVDTQKAIGTNATGFAAQSKIHTRNNVGESGKIYFGTKQGYPDPAKKEQRSDYLGGYPMVYDPAAGQTKVYPISIRHQGIISIAPDESRGVAYLSTCADERPDSTHFMILDLKKETYRDLGDMHHEYAFIVIDALGRAYHPILGGEIARYDPTADKLERLKQTIDGKPPTPESHLADTPTQPMNWEISPDRKTIYAVAMTGNQLYAYDVTTSTDTLTGRSLGKLIADAKQTDCRALCVGPEGDVWMGVATQTDHPLHLVSYHPGDAAPVDHGAIAIKNPDYTTFTDAAGKPLPWHHGVSKLADGTLVPKYYIMGICQAHNGAVYATTLYPFTLHEIGPPKR